MLYRVIKNEYTEGYSNGQIKQIQPFRTAEEIRLAVGGYILPFHFTFVL